VRRSDTEHHRDVTTIDLDALDQKADQIPLEAPIDSRQAITDLPGKVLKPAYDQ
jgi:hypothetical protein